MIFGALNRSFTVGLISKINLILKSDHFPCNWCEPSYKSGTKNDPSNYRGICLSSCLGKLFTSILKRLKKHVPQQNILHSAQIGFVPTNHPTSHIITPRNFNVKYVLNTPEGKLFTFFIDFKIKKGLRFAIVTMVMVFFTNSYNIT